MKSILCIAEVCVCRKCVYSVLSLTKPVPVKLAEVDNSLPLNFHLHHRLKLWHSRRCVLPSPNELIFNSFLKTSFDTVSCKFTFLIPVVAVERSGKHTHKLTHDTPVLSSYGKLQMLKWTAVSPRENDLEGHPLSFTNHSQLITSFPIAHICSFWFLFFWGRDWTIKNGGSKRGKTDRMTNWVVFVSHQAAQAAFSCGTGCSCIERLVSVR